MMKKILLFLLLSFLMTGSAFANCLMYIDDFTVTPDQLGTVIELRVKALYSARLNAWSLDLTFPEGLTPINAEPGADFDITYINSSGNTAIYTPLYYQYNDYTKLMGFAYEQGYWYDPNNGNALTSYGAVKWEVGTYEEMIILYVRVSEDFRGGEIVLHSEFSCTDDARGGTIRDVYGQQAIDYTCVCTVTFGSPEAYACYSPSNTTLTFYYDTQRSRRPGTTYDLNSADINDGIPGWYVEPTDEDASPVTQVVFDPSFADARPTFTSVWFADMYNLQSITGLEYLNTSEVTDMSWMFFNCYSLSSLDVSHFNTAKVTDMSGMFIDCVSLSSLDVSSFNTANVTNMYGMFYSCESLTSLDLSHFNTAKVTDMGNMFAGCSGLSSLDVSSFNTSKVANMSCTFLYCSNLSSLDLSSFNTSNVTDMSYMFSYCPSLSSIDLSHFNTAKVTDMCALFSGCSGLSSLDLSHFNTAKVIDMTRMFEGCWNLTTIYAGGGWTTAAVTDSEDMFYQCTSLVGGQGTTYDANHIGKEYAHIDGGPSNPGYFTAKSSFLRGDVNGDGQVKISDVTALINYLLSGDASAINLQAADTNQDGQIKIADVTALINYLLSGAW